MFIGLELSENLLVALLSHESVILIVSLGKMSLRPTFMPSCYSISDYWSRRDWILSGAP